MTIDWVKESDEVRAWLEGMGIVVNRTYRVAIDRLAMTMRVWQYAGEGGTFFQWGGNIVKRIPFDVRLDAIPAFVTEDRYGAGP